MRKQMNQENWQASAKRLFDVANEYGPKDWSAIGRDLGESDQTAWNWRDRGVSARAIIKASFVYNVEAMWLSEGEGLKRKTNLPEDALQLVADYLQLDDQLRSLVRQYAREKLDVMESKRLKEELDALRSQSSPLPADTARHS
jgi:hypothetical protein